MKNLIRTGCLLTAATFTSFAPYACAQEHVVPLNELQNKAAESGEARSRNMQDIERILAYPAAADALAKANVKPDQVHKAVATLDNAELARLADRARASEKDVQGGLIVGILALIGLIVVIIVVVTVVA